MGHETMMAVNMMLLIAALLPLFLHTDGQELVNAEIKVFGCYKQFNGYYSRDLGYDISNLQCQQECRSLGYQLSSTSKCTRCLCGFNYPYAAKTNDTDCLFSCKPQCASHTRPLQASCGSSNTHIISGTGKTDINKEMLRNMIQGWWKNDDYRNELVRRAALITPPVGPGLMMKNWDRGQCLVYPLGGIVPYECLPYGTDQYWKLEPAHGYYSPYYRIRNLDYERPHCLQFGDPFDPYSNRVFAATCSTSSEQQWTFEKIEMGYLVKHGQHKLFMWTDPKRIGAYNGRHFNDQVWLFKENDGSSTPEISATFTQDNGVMKKCTARVEDRSPTLDTYRCSQTSNTDNLVILEAVNMEVVDATPLTPSPPELLARMICDNKDSSTPLVCRRSTAVSYSVSSGYTATTTVNTETTVSASLKVSVRVGVPLFNTRTTTSLKSVIHNENAFTSSESRTETETVTQVYEAEVTVDPGKQVTINIFREKQDVTFAWKVQFTALGPFELQFPNGFKASDAISKIQADDYFVAFGMYTYPDVDAIRAKTTSNENVFLRRLDNLDN